MPRVARRRVFLLLLFVLGPLLAAPSLAAPSQVAAARNLAAEDPLSLLADQQRASLDVAGARRVAGQEIRLGEARISLQEGVLVPLRTPKGRVIELFFLGDGSLEAEPPDEIEASQLELFTGHRRLASKFKAALFAAAETRLRELSGEGQPILLAEADLALAQAILDGRSELAERELLDIDSQLLLATLGEPLTQDFFAAIFETEKLGVVCLAYDLEAENPLGIGRWEVFESEDPAVPEDVTGIFDLWMAGGLGVQSSQAPQSSSQARTTFESRHYDLRLELDPAAGKLVGVAEIELEALMPSRVVKLSLHGDLEVQEVHDPAGRKLLFERQGETLRVFLPGRIQVGERTSLKVSYQGHFFDAGKRRKSRGLRDNVAFYPHAGEVDEATYELELRWPRGWEVLAAGELTGEGKGPEGSWQKRRIDAPTWGISFMVGKFRLRSRKVGGVHLQLALGSDLGGSEKDAEEMLAAAASALEYFSQLFGPYPLPELTLASAPGEISQSLLGFIALSDEMMRSSGAEAEELGLEDRRTVIAHEIAHQWWGHQLGWKGERDQWLSEAMAGYSALLWARRHLPTGPEVEVGPTAAWQEDLAATLKVGRSLESLGPVVLGGRLDSSLSEDAYEAIVYRKGAVVLDTLAQLVGEAEYLEILGKIVRGARRRKLSTQDFIAQIEQLSGRDLSRFASQFIYGTGLPEIYYDYHVSPASGGAYRIEIEAEVEPSFHFSYALRRSEAGRIVIERRRQTEVDLARLDLFAEVQIELPSEGAAPRYEKRRVELAGPHPKVVLEVAEEPQGLELDPEQRVFARFWNKNLDPKRVFYYRAFDRAAAGDGAGARHLLEAALKAGSQASASTATPAHRAARESKAAAQLDQALDASIYFEKARLALTEGKLGEAASALATARKAVPKSFKEIYDDDLEYVSALLDWQKGEAEKTFRKLSVLILEKAKVDDTEAWLYLALAAQAAGHPDELEIAIAEVEARGVDASLLAKSH